jgi:tetratricopeptide (TPR) repeat protein
VDNLTTFDLGPFISNDFGDRYLYPVNREIFNRIGASAQYKKHFGEALFAEKTLHIVVGTDSGLLLRHIIKTSIPDVSRYVFIELPQVINRLEQEGLLDTLPEEITCISIDQLKNTADQLEFQNYLYTEKILIWKSLAAGDAYLPDYPELYWVAREFIDSFAWQIKVQLSNHTFIERQLENLAENRFSAVCLKDLFPGKTAVLLAGGPSLDDHLPWIQKHRKQLVVLAVSRIARRLKEVELVPDIFFSVDPHQPSFDVSKEMLFFGENTLFVNSFHVVPQLLSQWQGPTAFIGNRFPWQETSAETFLDAAGPTVTNAAFATAMQMGFAQIILAGVDLCFSPEGYSHAKGSYERQAGPQFHQFDAQIETNQGIRTFTTRAMAEAITSLGNLAEFALKKGCKTVNPTPLAAKISNIEHTPLENIDFEPLAEPAWDKIRLALPEDNAETRKNYFKKVLEKLRIAEKNILKIQKLAKEGLKCNDGLFGRNGMYADYKYKIRMDKVEKALCRPHIATYANLIKEGGLRQFLKISRPDSAREWSDEQIEETGRIYYQAYIDSAAQMLQYIQNSIARVELRLSEEDPQADLTQLVNAWRANAETGRALIWHRRHGNNTGKNPNAMDPQLSQAKNDFENSLAHNPEYLVSGAKGCASPEMARHRLRILFKNRDRTALTGIHQGLVASPEENNKAVCHLAEAYLAELENDFAKAFEEYQNVLESASEGVAEDALRRIASLSLELNNPQNALLALECLTGHSPMYLAQYADLANMLGQTKTALDAYADYLERFPEDLMVLLKVGQLYQQLGQHAYAQTVFQHILTQDPENEAAQKSLELSNNPPSS